MRKSILYLILIFFVNYSFAQKNEKIKQIEFLTKQIDSDSSLIVKIASGKFLETSDSRDSTRFEERYFFKDTQLVKVVYEDFRTIHETKTATIIYFRNGELMKVIEGISDRRLPYAFCNWYYSDNRFIDEKEEFDEESETYYTQSGLKQANYYLQKARKL